MIGRNSEILHVLEMQGIGKVKKQDSAFHGDSRIASSKRDANAGPSTVSIDTMRVMWLEESIYPLKS